jgi:SAM-dependent methyltransferase
MSSRDEMRRLAQQSIERGDATGWFEELYQRASGSWDRVPWADLVANPFLVEWLDAAAADGGGQRCLVVGCGLGDDAEALSAAGYDVVAFDIAQTAIDACGSRWTGSRVAYRAADVLAPPPEWIGHFDLVFESYTLQVLPPPARAGATAVLASLVAPGGRLLVLCRARDRDEAEGQLTWPLTREELDAFAAHGLDEVSCESFLDDESPPVRRFRALYRRSAAA